MSDPYAFLAGGGEVGDLMRRIDWAATPLGAITAWEPSLRTAVSIALRSPTPIVLMWGKAGVLVYNDAYAEFAGARHPSILGLPAEEAWPEIAPHNRHMIDTGLAGQTVTLRDQLMVLDRTGVPEDLYLDLFYSPVIGDGGTPAGVMVIVVETTDRILTERRRMAEMERMHRMFDQAPGFVAILGGEDLVFEFANPGCIALVGGRDVIGIPLAEALPEIVPQGFVGVMAEVFRSGAPYIGNSISVALRQGPDMPEEIRSLDFVYQPIRDEKAQITHILVMGTDVTARVRSEEHQRFLVNELNHRVKNSLATVQSVVRQTIRQSASLKDAGETISARILALSRAHDVLTGRSGAGSTIAAVVGSALEPHAGLGRITASGPTILLGRRQALALSLALHELATNALKYGALSSDGGRVDIAWTIDGNQPERFRLRWHEAGGPPARTPTRRGFGMDIIEKGLRADLEAEVAMDFAPAGLVLTLETDLAMVKDGW